MNQNPSELLTLLQRAKGGDQVALGRLLDYARPQLGDMANRSLVGELAARISGSDVVQQTCLSAVRAFENFTGDDIAQFIAWVRKLHEHNLRNTIRDHTVSEKRQVRREVRGADVINALAGRATTPSQKLQQRELKEQVEIALNALPEDQRSAVVLRYRREMSLKEMAASMQRSESAVAGLLKRGLANLREAFSNENHEE